MLHDSFVGPRNGSGRGKRPIKHLDRILTAGVAIVLYLSAAVAFAAEQVPDPVALLERTLTPPHAPYAATVAIEFGDGDNRTVRRLSVRFAPPQRYRRVLLEPSGKEGRTMISDGKIEWLYDPALREAWKGPAAESDGRILSPSSEFELAVKNYRPTVTGKQRVAGRECWDVELRPRRGNGPLRSVCVDAQNGIVLQARAYRADGVLASGMRYESVEFPPSMDEAGFRFEPPAGTQVVFGPPSQPTGHGEAGRNTGAEPHSPAWLPSGYVFQGAELLPFKRGSILHLRFSDGVYALSLFQCPRGSRLALGGAPSRSLKLSSGRARLLVKDDDTVLEWHENGLRFVLVGRLPPESLRRIAESVR